MTKKQLNQEDKDIVQSYFKGKPMSKAHKEKAGIALEDFVAHYKENMKDQDPLEFIGKTLEHNQTEADKKEKESSEDEAKRIRRGKDKLAISLVLLTALFLGWLYFF